MGDIHSDLGALAEQYQQGMIDYIQYLIEIQASALLRLSEARSKALDNVTAAQSELNRINSAIEVK